MTRQRASTIGFILTALLSGVAPATASAGSLLSGYAGPGAGSQAIIGSTLINPPSGKGPGAGAATSVDLSAPATAAGPGETTRSGAGGGSAASAGKHGRTGSADGKLGGSTAAGSASPGTHALIATGSSGGGPALGISAADLLLIALAVGVLTLTGVLTARLARTPAESRPLKRSDAAPE